MIVIIVRIGSYALLQDINPLITRAYSGLARIANEAGIGLRKYQKNMNWGLI